MNGVLSPDDDDGSSTDHDDIVNGGVTRDGRSVSSTLHDRTRTATTAININSAAKQSSRHSHSSHRHSTVHHAQNASGSGSGSSPPSARETFLNYFFGQNGPGPIAGPSGEKSQGQHVPIGRDTSMSDNSLNSGLMAGKRNLDGNNAAFDMKSLGKHIEAVRTFFALTSVSCC